MITATRRSRATWRLTPDTETQHDPDQRLKHADTAPQTLDAAAFPESDAADWAVVWIDLEGGQPDEHHAFLQKRLGLPRLAVDDALRQHHPPKYEGLDDSWCFQLIRGFDADSPNETVGTIQLALF